MIIRGSRQKLRRDATRRLQPLLDQLQLPWLCPALHHDFPRQQKARRSATSVERRPPRTPAVTLQQRAHDRGFAFAASAEPIPQDDYLPWDTSSRFSNTNAGKTFSWPSERTTSELPYFNPATPLIIPDSLQLAPRNFRFIDGIGGDVGDIHRVLQACLQLGQLDRASATVRRLNDIYKPDSLELVEAHNAYLSSMYAEIATTKDVGLLKHMHKWFEVEMRGIGIKPDETTVALMIQASFHDSNEKKIARTVRRYLAIAREYDIYDLAMGALYPRMTDAEFIRMTRYDEEAFGRESGIVIEEQTTALHSEGTEQVSERTCPTILAQKQKGLGLSALQKSLTTLLTSSRIAPGSGLTQEKISDEASMLKLQQQLENDTISSALERWRKDHEETQRRVGFNSTLTSKSLGAIMWTWHEKLLSALKDEVQAIKDAKPSSDKQQEVDRVMYGPFLQLLPLETLSATTILVTLQALTRSDSPKGIAVSKLVTNVGKAIEEESDAVIIQREMKKITKKVSPRERSRILAALVKRKQNLSHTFQALSKPNQVRPTSASTLPIDPAWSSTIVMKVGAVMISLLYKVATIQIPVETTGGGARYKTKSEPAFKKSTQFSHGRRLGVITLHKALAEKVMKEPVGSAIAKHLPMLIEPVPWTGYKEGGFLKQSVPVVRTSSHHAQTREYVKLASKSGDMVQVYKALDVLGKTPWKINRAVFNIMVDVWNSGEAIANIAPLDPKMDYPSDPGPNASKDERRHYAYKVKQIDNVKDGYHSNRCFQNFQLEVAKAFLKERFYFPHNMDFRGRAYPVPPYLNHMGADHCRGLLVFGNGRELGANGLNWLRVHLANVFGYDKASLAERRDFAHEHIGEIYDSAKNPLSGRRWWLKAEDPWQCLATCIELTNALDSSDPTKFVSHLPIHQDGTCNGLQHYAALGGDPIGARQVNLEPGDRPSDIYTAVAVMVQERIAEDAKAGDAMGILLDGKIKRKVVKQTVMTNVYGVTFAGAKLQVLRQLEDLYPEMFASDPRKLFLASSYVARKIFQSLSIMFTGAHDIQYWLGECASRICDAFSPQQIEWLKESAAGNKQSVPFSVTPTNQKSIQDEHSRFKSSVIWTSPLKMPIVQPYRKTSTKHVKTNLQKINLVEPSVADPVSKRKQLQAFPPNFIHSLDATHMFLSALKCNELGLSFAAVHDSFWTHAADVDTMNLVIRDAFIKMHSENIVGRLAAEFGARYKGGMYLATIKQRSPIGRKISKLRKKTHEKGQSLSQIKLDELLQEKKRLELLASSDPNERAKGEEMITPGRLLEERADAKEDLEVLEDLDGALGEVKDGEDAEVRADSPISASLDGHGVPDGSSDADSISEAIESEIGKQSKENESLLRAQANKAKKAQLARQNRKIWVWRPLSFPPVPNRVSPTICMREMLLLTIVQGSFDVSRLTESKYFFS